MKIKLYESNWDNKIKGELSLNFYNSIKDADVEKVKESSIQILEKCKEFFDIEGEDNDYILTDLDVMIKDFSEAEEDTEVDELLNDLYDFCDNYLILIDVSEEPEDTEVFIDSEKNTGTAEENKEEHEVEPVEVVEISPDEEK